MSRRHRPISEGAAWPAGRERLLALIFLALVWIASPAFSDTEPALSASDSTQAAPAPPSAADEPARSLAPDHHPTHRTAGQGIEDRVNLLSRGLGLDAAQQAQLRELLVNEHRQIAQVWRDNAQPTADRVGPTRAIIEHTKAQIRAMLTDEQRTKYPAAVPQGQLAPANADLDKWMSLMNQKAQSEAQ